MGFRLGDFQVEPTRNLVSGPGGSARLEPKVMELLVLLSSRPGDVFTKKDIAERLWPGLHVTESSLFRHVSELRRALGDDHRRPRYLETISKKGYRLLVDPVPVEESASPIPLLPLRRSRLRTLVWIAGASTVAIALVLAFPSHRGRRPRLAVLPFQSETEVAGTGLAQALSALLRNKLVLVETIDVVPARNEEEARRLGVLRMLSGTVESSQGSVRVTAWLTELGASSSSGPARALWSSRYDRPVEELVDVPGEIATSVAAALGSTLSSRERRRFARHHIPIDRSAYETYAKAELYDNRVDCRSYDRARDSYRGALARDPKFVDVYPKLFDVLIASAVLGCGPPASYYEEASSLLDAGKRNGLDPGSLAQKEAALRLWRDRDPASAVEAYRRVDEDPRSSRDIGYAVGLVASSRFDEAVLEASRCLAELPMELGENWALGGVFYMSRRYEKAIDQFAETLELYPGYRPALQMLALSYLGAGDVERAVRAAETSEPADDDRWNRFDAVPGYVYARAGDARRAREFLSRWRRRAAREWVPKTSLAMLELGLGNASAARRWLDEARREQDPWLVLVANDPVFASLGKDPASSSFAFTLE